MNKIISHGSYILIIPISDSGGMCKGKVYSKVFERQLSFEQIVYYLKKDITEITFEGEDLHLILHYHIFAKEIEIKEKKERKISDSFQFNGLSM